MEQGEDDLEYRLSHMVASSLVDHNYLITNQSINTNTINIPSSKVYDVKRSRQNAIESKIKKLSV